MSPYAAVRAINFGSKLVLKNVQTSRTYKIYNLDLKFLLAYNIMHNMHMHICVSICYLLRHVLKGTTGLGRNIGRSSVLMVPTSSSAKLNNSLAGNKLNSIFEKVMRFGMKSKSKFQWW